MSTVDDVFKALADPTRRRLLDTLRDRGGLTLTELEDGLATQPALRQSLLVERNDLFAARVVETIERRRVPFVAVGAGHMLGPDGLPALLAARGYTVRRVQ